MKVTTKKVKVQYSNKDLYQSTVSSGSYIRVMPAVLSKEDSIRRAQKLASFLQDHPKAAK